MNHGLEVVRHRQVEVGTSGSSLGLCSMSSPCRTIYDIDMEPSHNFQSSDEFSRPTTTTMLAALIIMNWQIIKMTDHVHSWPFVPLPVVLPLLFPLLCIYCQLQRPQL